MSLGFEITVWGDTKIGLDRQPVWLAMLAGIVVSGLCGWVIGKISFKVRGAYFVIVTVSFAEVVRLVALNWIELTQGPMALNNIPYLKIEVPGIVELSFLRKPSTYVLVMVVLVACYLMIRRLVNSRAGRAMIALREKRAASHQRRRRRHALPRPCHHDLGRDGGGRGRCSTRTTCASWILTSSSSFTRSRW